MVQVVRKPRSEIRPDPGQPRKHFPEEDLRRLAESMKEHGQLEPIQAQPDGTIIDGERRWRAAQLAGIETLLVIVTEKLLSPQEMATVRLTTFFHREGLSPFEKYCACEEYVRLHPGWLGKDLAAHLKVDPGTITKILAASRVCQPVREAFAAGKLGPSEVYAISKAPTEAAQLELLAAKLGGASRDEIEKKRGRKPSTGAPTVKLDRCRLPLSTGTTVVVTGSEMDLEGLIEALSAALEAARKANKDCLDVRTLQAVMKDKAKASA